MTYELPFDDAYEPYHASSPTDRVILELQMYGHRPHQDEPDPRPLPDDEVIRAGLAGIVETFAGMFGDPGSNPISTTCSGPLPTSSTAPPSVSPAASTVMKRRSVRARASRTGLR